MQDEKVIEWSEASALVWPVQPRLWFRLRWQWIARLTVVFVLRAIASWDRGVEPLSYAHDDVPEATDGDDISHRTTEEMEKYESLRCREFAHTRVYDLNLLERVGLDEELPTILRTIDWGKFYDEPHLGPRLLTLEFLMTFKTIEKNRKSFMKFCLFGKSFGCDFSRFSELLDFIKSCLPESSPMRKFNNVEFSEAISKKITRLRSSDIHNPSLRFLHKWMSFRLFPVAELHSIATPEIKCLFAMVNRSTPL
jgi:hypothetical protein